MREAAVTLQERRIATLIEERDYWREYALQLEAALAPDTLPAAIRRRLTRQQGRLLAALAARPWCTLDYLMLALYGDRFVDVGPKIVEVFIYHLRRKGIGIERLHGQGWALTAETRERIKALRAEERARCVA